MGEEKTSYQTIDEYISQHSPEAQRMMQDLRQIIHAEAPEATEKMSWQMPTFYQLGNLVHFAAHQKHIGFYPGPSGIEAFQEQLAAFKWSKGAVQFPLDKPLPEELVRQMVRYRLAENKRWAVEKLEIAREKKAEKQAERTRKKPEQI